MEPIVKKGRKSYGFKNSNVKIKKFWKHQCPFKSIWRSFLWLETQKCFYYEHIINGDKLIPPWHLQSRLNLYLILPVKVRNSSQSTKTNEFNQRIYTEAHILRITQYLVKSFGTLTAPLSIITSITCAFSTITSTACTLRTRRIAVACYKNVTQN